MKYQINKLFSLARSIEPEITTKRTSVPLKNLFYRSFNDASSHKKVNDPNSKNGSDLSLMPLADSFGRRHNYLRISLTERCNLRCQYCMPAEGVPLSARSALLTRDELLQLVKVFAAVGVDKVRLTGGEPTLRADLADVISGLRDTEGIRAVSMTTNGLVLTRRLPALQRAGLTAINVSLDSLRQDRYERMSRRPGLSRVLAGIDLALQLGYHPVKINTVLMKGFNDDEINDFVEFTKDRDVEVRFIEFMPFSGNKWDDSKMVPHRDAVRALLSAHPDAQPARARPNDTAVVWRVPGYVGSVGFISSMTQNFCSTCNRLRLTADGNLKVCLFGAAEVSLRDALRGGAGPEELNALIRRTLFNKKAKHAARSGMGRARGGAERIAARAYSTRARSDDEGSALSHLDVEGRARMVDVGHKPVTARAAEAECALMVNGRLLRLLRDARLPKGDALTVAQVAGALGAKRTADLIPMCHPLPLECVRVSIKLPPGECATGGAITVHCVAKATARTGVEMEALTGASVAALALYDMCKSVDREMRITELRVVRKSGGSSERREREPPPPLRPHDQTPFTSDETFAPTNFMHF